MLELQELGLVELNAHEQVEIEGGIIPLIVAGIIGFGIGYALAYLD